MKEEQTEEKSEEQQKEEIDIEEEMNKLKEEVKMHQEKYLRNLAEMENARKRMQREKHDMTRFAIENVLIEFLTPLDNLENALSFAHQTSEETKQWAKGFEMILTQFKDILENHKVISFQSEGMHFDPHKHEVIEMEETEKYEEGIILQEFMKGYKCGDRILRPARVKVAKRPKKEGKEEQVIEENKKDKE